MNSWPVTLEAVLKPARKKPDQYEFQSRNRAEIRDLPMNPYRVTVSSVKGAKSPGIEITCVFGKNTVNGQFHRKRDDKSIWLGSSFYTVSGHNPNATLTWRAFVSLFGISVGQDDREIPVHLDFYPDRRVVIRLVGAAPPTAGWSQARIAEGMEIVSSLLAAPAVPYAGLTPAQLPDSPGLYVIFKRDADEGQFLRAGQTDEGGLRQRLYANHLMGDQSGNLRAQLVGSGQCATLTQAKAWIRANCFVRFIIVEDRQTLKWAEHFLLALLRPQFGR